MTGWSDPRWRDEALAWVDGQLAARGVERDGEVEQPHVQWWSTALRIPTTGGVLWLKAAQPPGAFEARLTTLLAALRPDLTADVVATDPDRGWLLTRDAGTLLRNVEDGPSLGRWEELLQAYADLQRSLAPSAAELLALGVPSHSLADLPGQLDAALHDDASLLLGREDGLPVEQRDALLAARPAFAAMCARLAELGVPETLQHDDLHDGNAFVRNGGYVVFDWGDACVSHPFHTLVVTLRALAHRYQLAPGGVELLRLRDAYLEPWTADIAHEAVTESADLARRTGVVQRALAWHRTALAMPSGVREEYVDSVPYGLRLYLLDAPWGGWDDGSF